MSNIARMTLQLEWNPGDVYTVISPDVPGLVTEGRTMAEIQTNVQEALTTLMEFWKELGRMPPVSLKTLNHAY